jgi:hypothetical protein
MQDIDKFKIHMALIQALEAFLEEERTGKLRIGIDNPDHRRHKQYQAVVNRYAAVAIALLLAGWLAEVGSMPYGLALAQLLAVWLGLRVGAFAGSLVFALVGLAVSLVFTLVGLAVSLVFTLVGLAAAGLLEWLKGRK